MAHETAEGEGTLSRNFRRLATQSPELVPVAGVLVKHLGAAAYYEPIGSESRDAAASTRGEFRLDFVDGGEHPVDNAGMEQVYAA